jgi:hypothetical protein
MSHALITWDKIAKTDSVVYKVLILKMVYICLKQINSVV